LFWTGLNQVPQESIWTDLVAPAPFDTLQWERLFALTDVRAGAPLKGGSGSSSRANSEEPRKRLRVLDDRTSQLLAIVFSKLPPSERLALMVDTCEDFPDCLTPEGVLALHNAVSEHRDAVEQIRQVAVTQQAIAQLDMPEKVLLHLTSVPFFSAKLACGALIVGPARELPDLRRKVKEVGVCSQQLRKSPLLRKCISTALAVGNTLNRGTARSGVRGVVLPESLLKLEELRGGSMDASTDGGDKLGGTVLDFIAQALVNEDGAVHLHKDAESLLSKAKIAAGVSLEEAEASFNQLNEEAALTQKSLSEVPDSPGVSKLSSRVKYICEEIGYGASLMREVKADLAKTQAWCCCKSKVKSDDWISLWVQFLELLVRALGRAQESRARTQEDDKKRAVQEEKDAMDEKAARAPLRSVNAVPAMVPVAPHIVDESSVDCKDRSATCDGSKSKGKMRSSSRGCLLDDDAKMPDLSKVNFSQLGQIYGDPSMQAPKLFGDKENSIA
jgi:hypothetical protein